MAGVEPTASGYSLSMNAGVIIAIVVTALLVVVGLVVLGRRKGRARDEERRGQAAEHRNLAQVTQLEADRQAAEAEERAARAKGEQLASQQQGLEVERIRAQAKELESRADELDPTLATDA